MKVSCFGSLGDKFGQKMVTFKGDGNMLTFYLDLCRLVLVSHQLKYCIKYLLQMSVNLFCLFCSAFQAELRQQLATIQKITWSPTKIVRLFNMRSHPGEHNVRMVLINDGIFGNIVCSLVQIMLRMFTCTDNFDNVYLYR